VWGGGGRGRKGGGEEVQGLGGGEVLGACSCGESHIYVQLREALPIASPLPRVPVVRAWCWGKAIGSPLAPVCTRSVEGMSATEEQKVLLELFKKFHVQASLSITEIREITAKVFVELEVRWLLRRTPL
jgi:hypothetical protein